MNTPPPVLTLEGLSYAVESQARELDDLHAMMAELEKTIIEIVGRSGKDGLVGATAARLDASATSQGKRIGDLETEIGKLAQTKAQLLALAAIGMALLGAVAKAWFG